MRAASSGVLMSPLPITGIFTALLHGGDDAPIRACRCSLARACAGAPPPLRRQSISASLATSTATMEFSSQPARNLMVSGIFTAARTARKICSEQRQIAQQAGAAALDNFFGGAAEIDVDGVVAEVFDHTRGVGHHLRDWRRRVAR